MMEHNATFLIVYVGDYIFSFFIKIIKTKNKKKKKAEANLFIFVKMLRKGLSSPKFLDNLAKECLLPKHEKHDYK